MADESQTIRTFFLISAGFLGLLTAMFVGFSYSNNRCGDEFNPCYNIGEPNWLAWTGWSKCSGKFGISYRARFRHCEDSDKVCFGNWVQHEACYSPLPDCEGYLLHNPGAGSGLVESIHPKFPEPVICDFSDSSQAWMVILRRVSNSYFDQDYDNYVNGFRENDNYDNFWFGLQNLHFLTQVSFMKIKFELTSFSDEKGYAFYNKFSIGSKNSRYSIKLGNYHGTAGDSMKRHVGKGFSAKNSDPAIICSDDKNGGFWYISETDCGDVNLMGAYGSEPEGKGIFWKDFKNGALLKEVVVKIAYSK